MNKIFQKEIVCQILLLDLAEEKKLVAAEKRKVKERLNADVKQKENVTKRNVKQREDK